MQIPYQRAVASAVAPNEHVTMANEQRPKSTFSRALRSLLSANLGYTQIILQAMAVGKGCDWWPNPSPDEFKKAVIQKQ